MISLNERNEIINKIEDGLLSSECKSGATWWRNKHHPNKDIPRTIYLLGNGYSIVELFEKYNENQDIKIE